jgi:prepilin-type N-terminal cleavage/methylation domain-containing protein
LSYQKHEKGEQGFSLLELIVAIAVMTVVTGAIFALMRDTLKGSTATLEISDGQESLRSAHEYINRDLLNTGDGLNSISDIFVTSAFATNYLTLNPIPDLSTPGIVKLGLITTDNNIPANTLVFGTAPPVSVRADPFLTDRLSVLQSDRTFTAVTLAANAISINNGLVAVSPADVGLFSVGEIYLISSGEGSTFATITDRQGVGGPNPFLVFASGDTYGLNTVGVGSLLDKVSKNATVPCSISRMKIIHYYVNSRGLLMRRVFGVIGAGFSETVIAEPVVSLQFRYFMNLRDANGNTVQAAAQLMSSSQQTATRQIEVTITVETPHTLQNGRRQQISMTSSTGIRNMQFLQSSQPTKGGGAL